MPLRRRLVEGPTTVGALDQVRVDLVILVRHVLQLWRQVLHCAARCQVPLNGPRGPHVAQQLIVFPAPRVLFLLELLGNPLVLLLALHRKRNVIDSSCGLPWVVREWVWETLDLGGKEVEHYTAGRNAQQSGSRVNCVSENSKFLIFLFYFD